MLGLAGEREAIGDFLEWLQGPQKWTIVKTLPNKGCSWPDFERIGMSITEIMAAYFEIDLDALEAEKRSMLATLRSGT
jgi:hypothetical protein